MPLLLVVAVALAAPSPYVGTWYSEASGWTVTVRQKKGVWDIRVRAPDGDTEVVGEDPIVDPGGRLCFRIKDPERDRSEWLQLVILDARTVMIEPVKSRNNVTATRVDDTDPEKLAEMERARRMLAETKEVEVNVNGIRVAELAYDAAFDTFVAAGPWPRAVAQLTAEPVAWTSGSRFDELGWKPDGPVRSVYRVDLDVDVGYRVHGWIDADGDGVPAHWVATRDAPAARQTPEGVR